MLFAILIVVDLEAVRNKKQLLIVDTNCIRSNKRQIHYNYQPSQQIVVATEDPKPEQMTHGPYLINRIFTNGTVEL